MKKILVLTLGLMLLGAYPAYRAYAADSSSQSSSTQSEYYTQEREVRAYIMLSRVAQTTKRKMLYKGHNTSATYYFSDGRYYYPIVGNQYSTYKERNVSKYSYCCDLNGEMLFTDLQK